jgi:hypothetical protein
MDVIMKYDIFEFCAIGMTPGQRASRAVFLLFLVAVLALDLFVWRP